MSEFSIERSTLLRDEILDREWLQKQQDHFCDVTNLFAYCIDINGEPITRISGEPEQVRKMKELIDQKQIKELLARISGDGIEEQIIEDTIYANVKMAAVAITGGNPKEEILFYVLIVGIFKTEILKEREEHFIKSIDLLRETYQKMFELYSSVKRAETESKRSKRSQQETERSLKRMEAMTEMVRLLECDEPIDHTLATLLSICGQYLKISSAQIFRVCRDEKSVCMLSKWYQKEVEPLFAEGNNIPRHHLLQSDKLLVIGVQSAISQEEKDVLRSLGQKAVVIIPIRINGFISMYAAFNEQMLERNWKSEEVKFMHDAVRVMQSILVKRIQKNSLASSYASLESILDHVGSSILVKDSESNQVLFVNEMMKNTFEWEIQKDILPEMWKNHIPQENQMIKTEIYHEGQQSWYDLYFTYIHWVDGRKVILYAAYDITDKKSYQTEIEKQAYTDFLTGLYNRMCCERDLKLHIESARETTSMGAVLYLDLDDFKRINDNLGHQYGDVLLKEIARMMQHIQEISNTCYRIGGDEFVIIITPEYYGKLDDIVEKIKELFDAPWCLMDGEYYCTMSLGMARFPEEGDSVHDLIKKADTAMYTAKKNGKNRVVSYVDKL